MDFDIAEQLERIVALLEGHTFTSICALCALLLIMGFQKEGLFSKALAYLEARAIREAEKEERRIEILRMLESRNQRWLPGLEANPEEERKS